MTEVSRAKCTCVIHPSGSPFVPGLSVAIQGVEADPLTIRVGDDIVVFTTTFTVVPQDASRGIASILAESTAVVSTAAIDRDERRDERRLAPDHRRLVEEASRRPDEERRLCAEIKEKLKILGDAEARAEELCDSTIIEIERLCIRRAEREKIYERLVEILDAL
jgi:hypothetical protein